MRRRAHAFAIVRRTLEVLTRYARHRIEAWIQDSVLARWLVHRPLSRPERLRVGLEELGGSFVKLGQLLAMQRDVLPEPYCRALYDLLDRMTPVAFPDLAAVFEADQGMRIEEAFDRLDPRPLASASIAQVHRAERQGKAWAVKIQRPDAERVFHRDLAVMERLARWIRRLGPDSLRGVADALEELVDWTERELDFRWEARFATEIGRHAGGRRARVATVDPERSGRKVLTAELLEGPTLVDHFRRPDLGWSVPGFDPDRLADHVVETFLFDVFRHGTFHADLHPGNLIVLPDSVAGYVDFGICGRLSRHGRRHLVGMTLGFSRGDLGAILRHFEAMAGAESEASLRRFRAGMERLTDAWFVREGNRVVFRTRFSRVMMEMTRLSRDSGVWPQREVVLYMRSVVAADGLVSRLAPGYDLEHRIRSLAGRLTAEQALAETLAPERWLRRLGPPFDTDPVAPGGPARAGSSRSRSPARLAVLALATAALAVVASLLAWEPVASLSVHALSGLGLLSLFLVARRW